MTTLRAVAPAHTASNFTTEEILREARRVFVQPSALVSLMIEHLERLIDEQNSSTVAPTGLHCCPACGAQLALNETE